PTRELVVAVTGVAPFALRPADDRVEVSAGQKVEVKYRLDRLAGFNGAVTVTPLGFPGPLKMNQVSIAGGKAEGAVRVDAAAGAPGGGPRAGQGRGGGTQGEGEHAGHAARPAGSTRRPPGGQEVGPGGAGHSSMPGSSFHSRARFRSA